MYFMVTRFLKNIIVVAGLVSVVLSPFFVFSTAFAQISGGVNKGDYELLVPIPEFCAPGVKCVYTPGNFNSYVNTFIRLTIILAAILSVVMIVFGGFQYMTSESLGLKSEGKERMLNAIIGLVLLSASFLILNTINPNILSFKLDIKGVNVPTPTDNRAPVDNSTSGVATDVRDAGGELLPLLNTGSIPFNKPSSDKNKWPSERQEKSETYSAECRALGGQPSNDPTSNLIIRCLRPAN